MLGVEQLGPADDVATGLELLLGVALVRSRGPLALASLRHGG